MMGFVPASELYDIDAGVALPHPAEQATNTTTGGETL